MLADLLARGVVSTIHREDDDAGLEASWRLGIETVPALVRGDVRIVGWSRSQWEDFTGVTGLGAGQRLLAERDLLGQQVDLPDLLGGLQQHGGLLLIKRLDTQFF